MVQKPNIMLVIKDTGRWIVLSTSARNENKGAEWSTIPWTSTQQLNNLKAMVNGKNPIKSTKDLERYSNCVVGSNECAQWMVLSPSCKLTRTREQWVNSGVAIIEFSMIKN